MIYPRLSKITRYIKSPIIIIAGRRTVLKFKASGASLSQALIRRVVEKIISKIPHIKGKKPGSGELIGPMLSLIPS